MTIKKKDLKPPKALNLPKITKELPLSGSNPVYRILSSIVSVMEDSKDFQEIEMISQETSRISMTSEIMEMMLDEGLDSQNEFLPRFQSMQFSNENRRKIIRNCLDLKRIMDKDNSNMILADSLLQKTLYSKSNVNISSLFRCLKEYLDVETTIVITNLLLRSITNAENATSNAQYLAKKNLCPILLQNLQAIYSDNFPSQPSTPLSSNLLARIDEAFLNIYSLLSKLSKYEPKLALFARLHGAVSLTIKIMKRALDKRDFTLMMLALGMLKTYASKNENNLTTIQKSNLVPFIDIVIRISSQQSGGRMDLLIELLGLLAKSKYSAQEILKTFGMKFFLNQCSCMIESNQKAALKALKILTEYDFGKKQFEACDGSKILSETLNAILQSNDTASSLTLVNSVGSLLVAALRSAAGHSDLPFLEQFKLRHFPLPKEKSATDNPEKIELNYESLIDECAQFLLDGEYPAIPNPPESVEDLIRMKMRRLCPEVAYMDGKALPKCEPPSSNISVRHVQPMAPGKHFVCMNGVAMNPEPLLKRSPATFRKVLFEQTAKMFQTSKRGQLVFDVMDPAVAKQTASETTLLFDSRFESGNLQFAIKISQFEYDLLVEPDINSTPGRHNQWFYFSVKNMISNITYRFNVINLSKPASQFNNGMQPVMYSRQSPGWKRIGDYVFYIKNHYKKSTEPIDEDKVSDTQTYATLTFTTQFKNENDLCFMAYHYPYTYSELQRALYQLQSMPTFKLNCRRTLLCRTLGGNDCILLTITSFNDLTIPLSERKYVFLTARVHPGESNSSHIMHGLIQFLLSEDPLAVTLRKKCIFKIVPMLNPDGVINGSHRCSLAGHDLNRQWKTPSRTLSPTIFWTKLLYRFIVQLNKAPLLACDFHGHSRKKNVFLFGCENVNTEFDGLERVFGQMLSQQSTLLDLNSCKYSIDKSKESTSRVVLRQEFNIVNSFTLESTYCGMDTGDKKGFQIQIGDLESLGVAFAKTIYELVEHPEAIKTDTPRSSIVSDTSPGNTPKRPRKPRKKTAKVKKKTPPTPLSRQSSEKELEEAENQCSSDDDDDG